MASSNDNTVAAIAVITNLLESTSLNGKSTSSEPQATTNAPNPAQERDFEKNQLTFGIEYEFIAKATIKGDDICVPYPMNPLALLRIDRNDVNAEKIVAQFHYNAKQNEETVNYLYVLHKAIDHILGQNNIRVVNPEWDSNVSKGWFDKNDTSLKYPGAVDECTWTRVVDPDYKFFYYGVEVVSPILAVTEKGFDEAKKVADLLDSELLSFVNRSCGLHVHVGDGKKGFTLDTLKNIIGMLWIFDREIIRLHPKFRKSLSGNAYCQSLVAQTLGRWPQAGTIKAKLLEFYSATTYLELNCMLGHKGRYSAYNFENLSCFVNLTDEVKARKGGFHETIEFRQHEATLRGDRAMHWAKFCVAIVEYAMTNSTDEMRAMLLGEYNRQLRGNGTPIWDIVGNLGLDDTAKFFKDFVEEKERLHAIKKRMRIDFMYPVAMAEFSTSLRAHRLDADKKLQDAKRRLEEVEKDYKDIAEDFYKKGANRPDDIIDYDSDRESAYGEEIAYYGKAGREPEHKTLEKCFGAGECDAETLPETQHCHRCRPGYVAPVPAPEAVIETPMPAGWEEKVADVYFASDFGGGWGDDFDDGPIASTAATSFDGTSITEGEVDDDSSYVPKEDASEW